MEIIKEGLYFRIKPPAGRLPVELQGLFTSYPRAEEAIRLYRATKFNNKVLNVSERTRKIKAKNATSNLPSGD